MKPHDLQSSLSLTFVEGYELCTKRIDPREARRRLRLEILEVGESCEEGGGSTRDLEDEVLFDNVEVGVEFVLKNLVGSNVFDGSSSWC